MLVIAYKCLPAVIFLFITSLTASFKDGSSSSELEITVANNDLEAVQRLLNPPAIKVFLEEREWKIACIAAEKGNLNVLEYIVTRNLSILQKKNKSNCTIAHIAAQYGHLDLVCYVVKMDSRSSCRNYEDIIRTAIGKSQKIDNKTLELILKLESQWKDAYDCPSIIELAYQQNDTQIIQYLAGKKASLFLRRGLKTSLFKIAMKKNLVNQKFLEDLAENNALMNFGRSPFSGNTIAHWAAQFDRLDIIQFIANRSVSLLQETNYERQTVFSIAVENKFMDIIRYVVGEKPLMTVRKDWKTHWIRSDQPTTSAFHYAFKKNSIDMDTLKYLVEEKKVPLTITDSYDNETVAHTAASDGRIEILLYLVEKEPSLLIIRDGFSRTVLHILAENYHLSMNTSRFLIQKLANSTTRNDLCSEVGFIAAKRGNIYFLMCIVELEPSILRIAKYSTGTILHNLADKMKLLSIQELKYFVEKGAPLTVKNYYQQTVAHIFAGHGRIDLVECLVDRETSILNLVDHKGETILHKLARENALRVKSLARFIDKGASLWMKNKKGDTVVEIGARKGNIEILKYVVEKESSSLTKNSSILAEISDAAARYGHSNVLKFVAEKEPAFLAKEPGILFKLANASDVLDTVVYLKTTCETKIRNWDSRRFRSKVLQNVIEYNYLDILKYMKYDVNMMSKKGEPLIFTVIRRKRPDIFYYLATDRNADLTALDSEGNNILFIAARNRDLEKMKYILDTLKVPLEIEWRNNEGDTLLHVAVHEALTQADRGYNNSQRKDSERKQSEKYADNNYGEGTTESSESSEEKSLERNRDDLSVIEYLVEQKHADINARGHQNMTVLHCASSRGNYHISNYLLDHGADPTLRDQNEKTFWRVARFPNLS